VTSCHLPHHEARLGLHSHAKMIFVGREREGRDVDVIRI